jgi:hypothetical protein
MRGRTEECPQKAVGLVLQRRAVAYHAQNSSGCCFTNEVCVEAGGLRILWDSVDGARLPGQWINLVCTTHPSHILSATAGESHIRNVLNTRRYRYRYFSKDYRDIPDR